MVQVREAQPEELDYCQQQLEAHHYLAQVARLVSQETGTTGAPLGANDCAHGRAEHRSLSAGAVKLSARTQAIDSRPDRALRLLRSKSPPSRSPYRIVVAPEPHPHF